MVSAIQQALTQDGKFPLTLIVLDEVQQYIGEDSQRSIDVQEAVEACSKNLGGKVLFIGTGQTAVTGTANLKKLEGRFTVRVELSDADVEAVIRQVILAKRPEAKAPIEQVMTTNLGEISRQLAGTSLGHRQDDIAYFSQDYPILPVRRRFWEYTMRVLDQTGTDSQLRNQLSMVHKVIQTNLDKPLGNVVPADYLYFDGADKLLQARILPRKVHEKTMSWIKGTEDEQLMARATGLVFLINRLAGSNKELGIKATVDSIADLMVDDLSAGSSALRSKLPGLLDHCELLMKVGDEYRIQTEESSAWTNEFLSQRSQLANEAHRIESERDDRIRRKYQELVKKLILSQGASKVSREVTTTFDSKLPADADKRIYAWVRDGWSTDAASVKADAQSIGNTSPTVLVYLPKRSADDLRHHLIEYKAATATLERRGVPTTPEGIEARSAMETIRQTADAKIQDLLGDIYSGAQVFQGGGHEISGNNLQEMVQEAAQNSLQRLYPQFAMADHTGWAKVYERAKQGAPDALTAVGDPGEPAQNAVCKAVLGAIGAGKRGSDLRVQFEGAPYGWSGDAVDGAIQVLLVAGLLRGQDERGQTLDPRDIDRKALSKAFFKAESATVTTGQRIKIRQVMQKLDITAKQNEESQQVGAFLKALEDLALNAGGEAPLPKRPDTSLLADIRRSAGNEQLLLIHDNRDTLIGLIDDWRNLGERIQKRLPSWQQLQTLLTHAKGLTAADSFRSEAHDLEQGRLLLADPDPIAPLEAQLTQILRDRLNELAAEYDNGYAKRLNSLSTDASWNKLTSADQDALLASQKLDAANKPLIQVGTTTQVLETLERTSLQVLADRAAALQSRFQALAALAAQKVAPNVKLVDVDVTIPRATFELESEVDDWVKQVISQMNDVAAKLKAELANGPVGIR
jgi:hypothetical protein